MSDSETRLIDRRCRCGTPAAELSRSCEWHDAVSAQYATDLLAAYRSLVAESERESVPLWRRVLRVLVGGRRP